MKKKLKLDSVILTAILMLISVLVFAANGPATWSSAYVVNNMPTFTDAGTDARGETPGVWGSEYGRMTKLTNGNWLVVYTIYDNNGYTRSSTGGTRLQVARSTDNARTWTVIQTISDPGRDLDNGQMIQLPNGNLLMGCRSVRWQESYRLYVYRSIDLGATWTYLSTIDENNGTPGSLGNPDKGVYEPHFGFLDDGKLAVFYANEKHVTGSPAYSQIISEKVSSDYGTTWGSEIYVAWNPATPAARPGMPVWTKMSNGKYIVVFEVCGTEAANIHYKISNDGKTWTSGLGATIPEQSGGPYITSLSDGRLAVISNSHNVSFSNNYGSSWYKNDPAPWNGGFPNYYWPSIYQTGDNEIAVMTSCPRTQGGHNVQMKFGSILLSSLVVDNDTGTPGYTTTGTWTISSSSGYNNGIYQYAGAGSASTAKWTANIASSGTYKVSVIYRAGTNRATAAKYTVNTATGTQTVYVNQTLNSLTWVTLGTWNLNAGTATVTLDAAGSSGGASPVVIADAIKFEKTLPPAVTVDNDAGAPGYTENGSWISSSNPGYNGGAYRYTSVGSSKTAVWNLNLPSAGNWKISVIYKAGTNRATSVKYNVTTASGTQTVNVNQTLNDLTWVTLGTWNFNAAGGVVTLDAGGSTPSGLVVIADAVKAEPQ